MKNNKIKQTIRDEKTSIEVLMNEYTLMKMQYSLLKQILAYNKKQIERFVKSIHLQDEYEERLLEDEMSEEYQEIIKQCEIVDKFEDSIRLKKVN